MIEINVIGHPLIAAAYFLLALAAMFVRLPSNGDTWAARLGGASFFIGCGLHHLGMAVHIGDGRLPFDSFHHTLPTLMQVIGAPVFLVAISPRLKELGAVMRRG